MSDFNLLVRVRNARIVKHMRLVGFENVSVLCRHSGMADSLVGQLLNWKRSPVYRGRFTKTACRLADALRCLPEDLWPEHVIDYAAPDKPAEVEVSMCDVAVSLSAAVPDAHLALEHQELAEKALSVCSPRKRHVIRLLFGMDGQPEMTRIEVAETLGISNSRVNQIYHHELRRMKGAIYRTGVRPEDATLLFGGAA